MHWGMLPYFPQSSPDVSSLPDGQNQILLPMYGKVKAKRNTFARLVSNDSSSIQYLLCNVSYATYRVITDV